MGCASIEPTTFPSASRYATCYAKDAGVWGGGYKNLQIKKFTFYQLYLDPSKRLITFQARKTYGHYTDYKVTILVDFFEALESVMCDVIKYV